MYLVFHALGLGLDKVLFDWNSVKEIRMIKRFVSVTQACLCRIMSTEQVVADLQEIILLYMDAMVEIDGLFLNPNSMQDNKEFNNNDNDDHRMDYMTGNSD